LEINALVLAHLKTFVLYPHLPHHAIKNIDPDARLAEAIGLAHAINLEVVASETVVIKQVRANMLIGQGVVERIAEGIQDLEVELVIVDTSLSPVQQRNLEKAWNCKVIDRTGLILEIFGARAKTKEGSLQVELALLEYQKSRLVKSWSHLERQRGGLSAIGGPGETQLEVDRRLIAERIIKLKSELDKVKKRRGIQRRARQKIPYPIIALVGYTNAGKSTLFNKLTQANVFVQDLLFATLDPTMRQLSLPSGQKAILSDTVGFISDLPTQLISAFQATLEEVQAANIILHVQDLSNPQHQQQVDDVNEVLRDLGIDSNNHNVIDVLNKADCIEDFPITVYNNGAQKSFIISALTGSGLDTLKEAIDKILCHDHQVYNFILDSQQSKQLSWLHDHGQVTQQSFEDNGDMNLTVTLSPDNLNRYKKLFQ